MIEIDFRKWLCQVLGCKKYFCLEEVPPITLEKEVDFTFIYELLNKYCAFGKFFISDKRYYLPSVEDVQTFLALDDTDKEKYVTQFFDCDDFSFRLMGQIHVKPWASLAFGIAWSRVHAFNVFIGKDEQFYVVEPQNDKIMLYETVKDTKEYGDLRLVIM